MERESDSRLDSETSVYLTGGTGFIGSHFRNTLAERDVTVTILARPERTLDTRPNEQVECGDVTDPDSFTVEGHDVVVHLAGVTNVDDAVSNPRESWAVNADGTLNVLESARRSEVDRFCYASTASIYGSPEYLPIDEAHPTNPTDPYGASKGAGDALVRSYSSTYGMETIVGRIFNAFGPGQSEANVIPTIVTQARTDDSVRLGNLSPSRDFIFVEDVVDALITSIENGDAGTAYNIGRGEASTIETVAETVIGLLDRDVSLVSTAERQRSKNVEIPRHVADISRLQELGWSPEHDLTYGLQKMIDHSATD
ncbi:NAD-dependent epimerase/dehydratase family protein [Haladaptatus sp. NG-SE-30]